MAFKIDPSQKRALEDVQSRAKDGAKIADTAQKGVERAELAKKAGLSDVETLRRASRSVVSEAKLDKPQKVKFASLVDSAKSAAGLLKKLTGEASLESAFSALDHSVASMVEKPDRSRRLTSAPKALQAWPRIMQSLRWLDELPNNAQTRADRKLLEGLRDQAAPEVETFAKAFKRGPIREAFSNSPVWKALNLETFKGDRPDFLRHIAQLVERDGKVGPYEPHKGLWQPGSKQLANGLRGWASKIEKHPGGINPYYTCDLAMDFNTKTDLGALLYAMSVMDDTHESLPGTKGKTSGYPDSPKRK